MNLLIDGLPDSVEVAGQRIPIRTDFQTGILFEEALLDGSLDDLEKVRTGLALYFPQYKFPASLEAAAFQALAWFYRCGAEAPAETDEADMDDEGEDPPFSYEHDAGYIYSAFLQAYGLNLTQTPLHWWQFRALFRSLPESTMFVKIIGYRTMNTDGMTGEQRQHYEDLKRIYALPQSADRQQLESDLNNLLLNGGNPAAILDSEVRSWEQMAP